MPPLEKFFRLEIEFQRRMRTQSIGLADPASLHTNHVLQTGYESLFRMIGGITQVDLNAMQSRLLLEGDPRDVVEVRKSLRQCLSG